METKQENKNNAVDNSSENIELRIKIIKKQNKIKK